MKTARPQARSYFVPDLSPEARKQLESEQARFIFVAESPHVSEVEPEREKDRRPLCGVAGRQWWRTLSEILEGEPNPDTSLDRQLEVCRRHGVVVLNAVQYPLDPKITRLFPGADPMKHVGFSKTAGPSSFRKKKKSAEVREAVKSLRRRLEHPAVRGLPVIALGNDAEWFVSEALGPEERDRRLKDKVPHPSAWWRQGGAFGRTARQKLEKILSPG